MVTAVPDDNTNKTKEEADKKQERKTFRELIDTLKENTKALPSKAADGVKSATGTALNRTRDLLSVENFTRLFIDQQESDILFNIASLFGESDSERKQREKEETARAKQKEKESKVKPSQKQTTLPETIPTPENPIPAPTVPSNDSPTKKRTPKPKEPTSSIPDGKFDDLISKQDETIELLKHIDENTKVDTLKAREDEIKSRNRERQAKVFNNDSKKSLLGGALAGGLLEGAGDLLTKAIGGLLGLKGVSAASDLLTGRRSGTPPIIANDGKTGKPAKGKVPKTGGKFGMLAKVGGLLGLGTVAATTVASTIPDIIDDAPKASNGVKNASTGTTDTKVPKTTQNVSVEVKPTSPVASTAKGALSKAGGVAGKALAPLAALSTGYELYDVTTNESLTTEEKNKEYTSIGSRLAGAWVGAKAGGLAGATVGGVAGSVVPVAGNAAGATAGGLIGSIGGGIAGFYAGDAIGESIGNSLFTSQSNEETIYNLMNDDTKTYPPLVKEYVDGVPGVPFINVEEIYHKYLKSQNIKFDDKTAAIALTKLRNKNISDRVVIKRMTTIADNNSIDRVSNNATSNSGISFEQVFAPTPKNNNADIINVGAARNEALSTLSNDIDQRYIQDNIKESNTQVQPIIIPANNGTTNNGSNDRTRSGVPSIRNNENTIQRLLDNSYRPLLN